MPLQKQNVSISFAQGEDTKTDPRQVVPGKLENVENCLFTEGVALTKRNGFGGGFTGGSIGHNMATYQQELLAFDDQEVRSRNPVSGGFRSKGFCQPIDVATTQVFNPSIAPASANTLIPASRYLIDSAFHAISGNIIYVWPDSPGIADAVKYSISNKETNQVLVAPTAVIGPSAHTPYHRARCFALGNYFIIVYEAAEATGHIEYTAINASTFAETTGVIYSSIVNRVGSNGIDGVVRNNVLYLAINDASSVTVTSINSSLVVGSNVTTAIGYIVSSVALWIDTTTTPNNLWIATSIASLTNIRIDYFILNTALATILPVTLIENTSTPSTADHIVDIIGSVIGPGGISAIYYEVRHYFDVAANRRENYIRSVSATSAGTVGSLGTILTGVSIFSRAFQINGSTDYNYFFAVYGTQSNLNLGVDDPRELRPQNTYFLFAHHVYSSGILNETHNLPLATAKIAQGNARPYPITNVSSSQQGSGQIWAASVNSISSTEFQIAFAGATRVITESGAPTVLTYSIFNGFLDFSNNDAYQFAEAGSVLQTIGGFLWMYDSQRPVEQNFHLFPDYMDVTSQTIGSGGIPKNPVDAPYQYIALYEWVDSRGILHRSTTSQIFSIDISGATNDHNEIDIVLPDLHVTEKPNPSVVIAFYRNTPTAPGGNPIDIFYRVSPSTSPTSTTNGSGAALADTTPDADIIGNEILYTTGGVQPNTGGPPCAGITVYKNRLFVIDAEDRNILWFSKTLVDSAPVEMCTNFTLFVDPRFGPMTAISVMDDKLIVFKENAIFYFTGSGPDNTGANNDFSDATSVSSNVGCVDPRSIVTTQDGLMFKSNKGIYLLDRGLGLSYIGAPMESFNQFHVTGAELLPDTTQILFPLDDGDTVLLYDYFFKQWGKFTGLNVAGCTVSPDGLFSFIDPSANFYIESPGSSTDLFTPFYQTLTTSWLSLAGLQGFQRVYALFLLTKYLQPHFIQVDIAYDFDPTIVQTVTLNATELAAKNGTTAASQWKINLDRQKCQAIQITITELQDPDWGEDISMVIEAIGLLVGSKLTYPKLPAIQEATS